MPTAATQLIRIGHSPDPDDAFMFYALAKQKVAMRGFQVEHIIEDIETLNQRALQFGAYKNTAPLEVTAISCHAYAYLSDRYLVLRSGASVGDQYGPILVAKKKRGTKHRAPSAGKKGIIKLGTRNSALGASIKGAKIAVPGKLTTAYLTLQLFEPDFKPVFIPFDQILDAVQSGKADFGLVIHEGQITYENHRLEKVIDLGSWWYEKTKLPLPLGIDAIRRDLGEETIRSFAGLFKESIEYALRHRKEALQYALQFGRGIDEKAGDRFVGMYVNDLTVDLGGRGQAGLKRLYQEAYAQGILTQEVALEFVGE